MVPHGTDDGALRLRPQNDDDRDFLLRLYAGTRSEEMALLDWSEAQKRDFLQMQFDAQSRHYAGHFPDASFDIVELGGEPAGRLYVDEFDGEIRIIDIALLPGYRRRGLGTHYLRSLMRRAAEIGACVTIHVEKNNPAMVLYERLGFERVTDKGVYWFMRWRAAAAQENTAS